MLRKSEYDVEETKFLIDGFTNGFDIGYQGPEIRQSCSENIPFLIGTKEELWSKIMKEVQAKRVAGPFEHIPFKNYIQSPVGLVPKAGGKTRMIFHLSYNFNKDSKNGDNSLNGLTPPELCSVKYNDLDAAVMNCLRLIEHYQQQETDKSGNDCNKDKQPVIFQVHSEYLGLK